MIPTFLKFLTAVDNIMQITMRYSTKQRRAQNCHKHHTRNEKINQKFRDTHQSPTKKWDCFNNNRTSTILYATQCAP